MRLNKHTYIQTYMFHFRLIFYTRVQTYIADAFRDAAVVLRQVVSVDTISPFTTMAQYFLKIKENANYIDEVAEDVVGGVVHYRSL